MQSLFERRNEAYGWTRELACWKGTTSEEGAVAVDSQLEPRDSYIRTREYGVLEHQ